MASETQTSPTLSPATAFGLLMILALSWGAAWPVNKAILSYLSPLWSVAARLALGALVVGLIGILSGKLRLPPRQDIPVVLSLALLHMSAFGMLCALGLMYVSAGRTVLLAYTTPLWVFPFAWLFAGETMSAQRLAAIASGILGLLLLVNPLAIEWQDSGVLTGHALILLAAIIWAASIVFTRIHRWASSAFDLLFWQLALAAVTCTTAALIFEGWPSIDATPHFYALLLYGGTISSSLAYWAQSTINRSLPATSTALGLLAVPVFGVVSSMIMLGEPFDAFTIAALLLIVGGIAIGILPSRKIRSQAVAPSRGGPKAP